MLVKEMYVLCSAEAEWIWLVILAEGMGFLNPKGYKYLRKCSYKVTLLQLGEGQVGPCSENTLTKTFLSNQ